MENKLGKPSRLKPPTTSRLFLTKSTTNLSSVVSSTSTDKMDPPIRPAPKRLPLSRRSKSFSDLRTASRVLNKPLNPIDNVKKPFVRPILPARKPVAVTTTASSLGKRQAVEKAVDTSTKPKVLKPAKPAPYDYKARFALLSEKYKTLLDSTNEMKEKHGQMITEAENYKVETDKLKQKLKKCEMFEKQHVGCKETISQLQNEKVLAQKKIEELSDSITCMQSELKIKQTAHDKISSELKQANLDLQSLNTAVDVANDKISQLQVEVRNHEDLRRQLHNTIQDLKGNIRVFCRVRPANYDEDDKLLCNIDYLDENNMEIRKSRDSIKSGTGSKPTELYLDFSFDKVFPPDSSQDQVFEDLAQLVQSALDGYNVCVFAYGQTGSGKTFTMQGTNSKLGMIPRTIDLLFKKIERLKELGWEYEVQTCFLEIYNETIKDLIDPGLKKHEIHFNLGRGVTVTNLRVETINSASEFRELMTAAHNNRAVAATNYNEHSSRSHAVTKITMLGVHKESNTEYYGTLVLVDLAGSESPKNTTADRITETKNINKSLSTLGTVMLSLHNKEKHIPYRNSKLTYLLQSCLGGNSKTLMFVNIAPFEECYAETVNSLRFASKVKEVKTGIARNGRKTVLKSV